MIDHADTVRRVNGPRVPTSRSRAGRAGRDAHSDRDPRFGSFATSEWTKPRSLHPSRRTLVAVTLLRRWPILADKATARVALVLPVSLAISAGTVLPGDEGIHGGTAFSSEAALGSATSAGWTLIVWTLVPLTVGAILLTRCDG